jgi:hypothetical protein
MTNLSAALEMVPLVPGPVQTLKIARVFGSVISIGGSGIRAFDRDFGYVRFCEHPGSDYQRDEGDQNNKFSPHCSPQARRPKLEHPQLERSIFEPI